MKFFLVAAAMAIAGTAIAAAPYPCYLAQEDAEEIVGLYSSILQNKTYNGRPPVENYKLVLSPEYIEYSDSILSLVSKNNTLGDGASPSAVGPDQWFAGVSQYPIPKITTHDILVAVGGNIVWHWTFEGIGINKAPAKGFNLFRIDENLQIYEADIEFNSIAWGLDIFGIQQYCS